MQNIDLIAIGKMNAAYFAAGRGRVPEAPGRLLQLPHHRTARGLPIADKNASDRQIAKAAAERGRRHLSLSVRKGAYLVALCVEGKQISSEDLAALLAERAGSGTGDIAFVIGSSHGLDDRVKKAAQARISMGLHHTAPPAGPPGADRTTLPRLHHQRRYEVPQINLPLHKNPRTRNRELHPIC